MERAEMSSGNKSLVDKGKEAVNDPPPGWNDPPIVNFDAKPVTTKLTKRAFFPGLSGEDSEAKPNEAAKVVLAGGMPPLPGANSIVDFVPALPPPFGRGRETGPSGHGVADPAVVPVYPSIFGRGREAESSERSVAQSSDVPTFPHPFGRKSETN